MHHPDHPIKPGMFEVFCGPMKSGKSKALLHRIDRMNYISSCRYLLVKPSIDTRDKGIRSRHGGKETRCIIIEDKKPEQILDHIDKDTGMVAIEEVQFFNKKIRKIIEKLLKKDINVIAAGLDLDFRGEPFPCMSELLSIADSVTKLTAVCELPGCNSPSTRTQRLINGKPAPYDEPVISIENSASKESYQTRCARHHHVPGKEPKFNKTSCFTRQI